jgi:hypothetical protein
MHTIETISLIYCLLVAVVAQCISFDDIYNTVYMLRVGFFVFWTNCETSPGCRCVEVTSTDYGFTGKMSDDRKPPARGSSKRKQEGSDGDSLDVSKQEKTGNDGKTDGIQTRSKTKRKKRGKRRSGTSSRSSSSCCIRYVQPEAKNE